MTDRAERALSWLDGRADEMAGLVEELVALDTENPPGRALGRCGRLLHDALERLDLAPELIELEPAGGLEEPCIVRGRAGDGARVVYFHGHFDVVPAQHRSQFVPRRENGRIVGRGTADMKGGLVSMMYGAAAATELGLPRDGRVVLHLVCDEETGSSTGSGHLVEAGMIDPQAAAMLTPEPTGGVVWHASRGALTLRVDVRGREAHVGQPHLGVNAFEHMIRVAEPLAALAGELRGRHTALPVGDEQGRGSMLVLGGEAGSGAGFNVVPGSAWFSVDLRLNPEEDGDEMLARVLERIESAAASAGADVTVDVIQKAPAASTNDTHPSALALACCVERVEGAPPRFELCPGVLETRWYAQPGIPSFAYGPGRLDVSHGPHEFVEEAALRRCAAVYALAAGELLA